MAYREKLGIRHVGQTQDDVYDMGSGYLITAYITDAKKASANENKSVIVEMAVNDVSFELIKQKLHEEYK